MNSFDSESEKSINLTDINFSEFLSDPKINILLTDEMKNVCRFESAIKDPKRTFYLDNSGLKVFPSYSNVSIFKYDYDKFISGEKDILHLYTKGGGIYSFWKMYRSIEGKFFIIRETLKEAEINIIAREISKDVLEEEFKDKIIHEN